MKTQDLKLELMDWKALEKSSEDALRKQLLDLEVTRNLRLLAKEQIEKMGGKISEVELEEAKELMKQEGKLKKKFSSGERTNADD